MSIGDRRAFLTALAFAGVAASARPTLADVDDGHAHGHDVAPAPAADRLATLPRKSGDPLVFTAPLDDGPMKSTSGGWAREITTRQLPLAANLAIAHLFIAAGGIREMHWHTSSEWAYVLDGHCQIAVTGADGAIEVANLAAGDLWYFPAGRPHSVQTLGHEPCHAILVFDDGNYGEHGTFGLTDLVSRMAPPFLSAAFGPPESAFSRFPAAETYVMQGPVLAVDGPEASAAQPFAPQKSHRFAILAFPAARRGSGGTLRVASAREFPSSSRMSGMHLQLDSRGAQAPHWHPNADEMLYVAAGRVRAVMFGPDKRLAVAELGAGDCVYFPRGCAHFLENVGDDRAELVGATNAGEYEEVLLGDWFVRAPRHTLAANLGIPEPELPRFNSRPEALILR